MTDSEDEGSLDDECPINEEWLEDVLGCYHRQRVGGTDQQLCVKVSQHWANDIILKQYYYYFLSNHFLCRWGTSRCGRGARPTRTC